MKTCLRLSVIGFTIVMLMSCITGRRILNTLANAPTQHVLVNTHPNSLTDGYFVRVHIFPPQGGHRSASIGGDGGLSLLQLAKPFATVGIGANNDVYVAAWWCGRPGFNTLCIAVSEDGELWDLPGSFTIAASSQIDNKSGPSVTYFPPRDSWFVTFRDAATSKIMLTELNIHCAAQPGGGCGDNNLGATQYSASIVAGPTLLTTVASGSTPAPAPIAPVTNFRPTISHVAGKLIVAYNAYGTTPMTATVATSETGAMPFVSTRTGLVSDGGAPYVNNSIGDLLLAVGRITSNGSVDLDVFTSSDGMTFAPVRTIPSVSSALPGLISPAISGTAAENLVAFHSNGAQSTTVDINGNQIHLSAGTEGSVSIAHGPGPHATAEHSCAEPFLMVSGDPDSVTLSANESGSVSTNGDAELQCGSFQAPAGCPSNTKRVRVFRTLPGVIVECW